MSDIDEISVDDLRRWREERRPHLLIDVREPSEYALTCIEGSQLVPLGQLPSQVAALPRDTTIVVCCRSGARSGVAVAMLRAQGLDAVNMVGGMLAWDRTR